MCAKVLLIGSGGREHAITWKLEQSAAVKEVVVSPGNGGTEDHGLQDVPVSDYNKLSEWCVKQKVDLVVVGSEVPLANGICDVLMTKNVACFGPTKAAAQIESSKEFSKWFMIKYNIPTAKYKSFVDPDCAKKYIDECEYDLVVKASGLAAGKGVIVCKNKDEAKAAVEEIMVSKSHGNAGETIILEEKLIGEEVSVLCFTDGLNIASMPCSQDHKQLLDGDIGPNTGGMGAYCPCPQISDKHISWIKENILQKSVNGLKQENRTFRGVLYAGLMLTKEGPKVLEFNCRFGDPETQVILPLLNSDLFTIMMQCARGGLKPNEVEWNHNKSSMCAVLVSGGYPGKYEKGKPIYGLENVRKNTLLFEAGTKNCNGAKLTSGGRVLAVTSICDTLPECRENVLNSMKEICFENSFYRRDIGWKAIKYLKTKESYLTYASSGVDVNAGNEFVETISSIVKTTARSGSSADIGGFGGFFDMKQAGYNDPVLVSGTDGVGTKLLIAQECNMHSTIGIDLVAMCVNDIITHNAEPLFFLDYFACGKLKPQTAVEVVKGITEGCKSAGCALIGGETAEMPGMYFNNHYDMAGFAVGAYDKILHTPLPQFSDICENDVIIGLTSSGVHSNGFSLVRKVIETQHLSYLDKSPFSDETLGACLLTPTAIYSKALLPILRQDKNGIKALAHVTGGGLWENLPRVLPSNLRAELNAKLWEIPTIFGWLYKTGNIEAEEMLRTFNCGIGMAIIVDKVKKDVVLQQCKVAMQQINLDAFIIGHVSNRIKEGVIVRYIKESLEKSWNGEYIERNGLTPKARIAVLISGSGTNMQSIINHQDNMQYKVCVVICNKSDAKGLQKARDAGVPTHVIKHKEFKTRMEFDMEIDKYLLKYDIDIVCLAGFMRLLSKQFVEKWTGKILNIHPSLLPAFKGINAQEQALKAGVKITGCTVHFVTAELDDGAIISQTAVKVLPKDSVETLSQRVLVEEHKIYPEAIDLLAQNKIYFDTANNTVTWN